MAIQAFLQRIAGFTEQVRALVVSAGADDAGKIVATAPDGKLHPSLIPKIPNPNAFQIPNKVELTEGMFVSIVQDNGAAIIEPASNDGKPATGFVVDSFLDNDIAFAYPISDINNKLTGLIPGTRYWLGTNGGVTDTPLNEDDPANKGKYSQQLGVAISATELKTIDYGFVRL